MGDQTRLPRPGAGTYVLVVLLIGSTLSYIDRQIISLVVQPIKTAFGLSDTQVGLLQGIAFSLCYAVAGLPLALAVDRSNRVRLASACVTVWSMATSACGMVSSYIGLLLARATTAVSEAGFSPAALSILSDVVPPQRIARVGAIYLLGPALGVGLALMLGGWTLEWLESTGGLSLFGVQYAPWQALFICIGAPGLIVAALILATIREPARTDAAIAARRSPGNARSLFAALRTTGDFLIPYVIGTTLIMLVQFAQAAWMPTFFVRQWGLEPHSAGQTLGPIFIVSAIAGAITTGVLAKGEDGQRTLERVVQIVLVGSAVLGPSIVLLPLVPSYTLALVLFSALAFSFSAIASLSTAPMLLVMPSAVRGQSIAAGGFLLAVVGGGGGPLAVGLATDYLFQDEAKIGWSISLVCGISVAAGVASMLRARHVLIHRWGVRRDAATPSVSSIPAHSNET
jgi:MFS family permease